MNDPLLFSQNNDAHKINTNKILENYTPLLKLKDYSNVLDVGAGDGSISVEVLLPKLPKNFKTFTLSDRSKAMVDFAKTKYNNPRIDFLQMDISSTTIPANLSENFDHIFSFACLNWVPEDRQTQAMKNIFDMLKPGGSTFLTIVGKSLLYDIYENMIKCDKWAPYMKNMRDYISFYHYVEKPETELQQFLENVGFDVQLAKVERCCYVYSNWQACMNFVLAINPFIKSIPENEFDSYVEELTRELKKHRKITTETFNGIEKIYLSFDTLLACAYKAF